MIEGPTKVVTDATAITTAAISFWGILPEVVSTIAGALSIVYLTIQIVIAIDKWKNRRRGQNNAPNP